MEVNMGVNIIWQTEVECQMSGAVRAVMVAVISELNEWNLRQLKCRLGLKTSEHYR